MEKSNIENKIEQALNSLNGIERASPGPFFFTRLQVRMNRQACLPDRQARNFWDDVSSFLMRPVVALAGILVIALLNLTAIYSNNDNSTDTSPTEYPANDEYVQLTNSVYEIENIKP